jgi:hypothetical protein
MGSTTTVAWHSSWMLTGWALTSTSGLGSTYLSTQIRTRAIFGATSPTMRPESGTSHPRGHLCSGTVLAVATRRSPARTAT